MKRILLWNGLTLTLGSRTYYVSFLSILLALAAGFVISAAVYALKRIIVS